MITFKEERQPLHPSENIAAGFAACALTSSLLSRGLSHLGRRSNNNNVNSSSGSMAAVFEVNFISASANWILFLADSPVVEPVTGYRLHLVRCCEWAVHIVLAFVMTFVYNGSNNNNDDNRSKPSSDSKRVFNLFDAQSLSVIVCGLVLPFVSIALAAWMGAAAVSDDERAAPFTSTAFSPFIFDCFVDVFANALYMHVVLDRHQPRCLVVDNNPASAATAAFSTSTAERQSSSSSKSPSEEEHQLGQFLVSAVWQQPSSSLGALIASTRFLTTTTAAAATTRSTTRAGMNHGTEGTAGIARRSSSTFLVTTTLSPPALAMVGLLETPETSAANKAANNPANNPGAAAAVIFPDESTTTTPAASTPHSPASFRYVDEKNVNKSTPSTTCTGTLSSPFEQLVRRAWSIYDETIIKTEEETAAATGQGTNDTPETPPPPTTQLTFVETVVCSRKKEGVQTTTAVVLCEAKVTVLGGGRELVIGVCDVTERTKQDKAEKQRIASFVARQVDLKANSFVRHEVKNALLVAIGLCDDLSDMHERGIIRTRRCRRGSNSSNTGDAEPSSLVCHRTRSKTCTEDRPSSSSSSSSSPDCESSEGTATEDDCAMATMIMMKASLTELDSTLASCLTSVTISAVSRELIHNAYAPRNQVVDVMKLLQLQPSSPPPSSSCLSSSSSSSSPSPSPSMVVHGASTPEMTPQLTLDSQLLQCFHQNALTNARKFGLRNGHVAVVVSYDRAASELTLEVTNQPGPNHEVLRAMSTEEASQLVFPNDDGSGHRRHRRWGGALRGLRGGGGKSSSSSSSSASSSSTVAVSAAANDHKQHNDEEGGWLMRECGRLLGGKVEIRFGPESTVVTLKCPAGINSKVAVPSSAPSTAAATPSSSPSSSSSEPAAADGFSPSDKLSPDGAPQACFFELAAKAEEAAASSHHFEEGYPKDAQVSSTTNNTTTTTTTTSVSSSVSSSVNSTGWKVPNPRSVWGLAIDDSAMQRKLLRKILTHVGIPEDHIIVTGETVRQVGRPLLENFFLSLSATSYVARFTSDIFSRLRDVCCDCLSNRLMSVWALLRWLKHMYSKTTQRTGTWSSQTNI
jgi:hypothetical protein